MMVVPASSLSRSEMHMLGSNIVGAVQRDRAKRESAGRLAQSLQADVVPFIPIRIGRASGSGRPIRMAS